MELGVIKTHKTKKRMDEEIVATIDELLERLERMKEMEEIQQLHSLNAEREVLLQEIELSYKALEKTADLVLETTKTLSLLQALVEAIDGTQATAERKWLAYWGIKEADEREETSVEMQQLS